MGGLYATSMQHTSASFLQVHCVLALHCIIARCCHHILQVAQRSICLVIYIYIWDSVILNVAHHKHPTELQRACRLQLQQLLLCSGVP
jgi:hypothetical protein